MFDALYRRLTAWRGVALAVLTVLLGLICSRLGVRFDGFIDVHISGTGVGVAPLQAVTDQIVAVVLPSAVLIAVLRAFRVRVGPANALGVVGLVRFPLVVTGFFVPKLMTLVPLTHNPAAPDQRLFAVVAGSLTLLLLVIALLVAGVRGLTGFHGGRLAGAVAAVMLAAEVSSKFAVASAG
ncbi:MAG: hypothetical protein ABJE47_05720 [bacterium]